MKSGLRKYDLIAFIALGTVSLFADWTYEGGRSVLGPYFNLLNASAIVVGAATLGDFLGYLVRGVGGLAARRFRSSKAYWALVIIGYTVNLLAVPLLAFAGNWEVALVLVLLERIGKGLRTPVRDAILAEVTEGMGRGKGFGLHEVMDQLGAVTGPAFVTWSLISSGGNYRLTYEYLAIPAFIALSLIAVAFVSHPKVRSATSEATGRKELGKDFWTYTISMALLAGGFMHWILVGYILNTSERFGGVVIGSIYLVAMLSDAVIAFPAGYLYDKYGPKTLVVAPALAFIATTLFLTSVNISVLITGSVVWGVLMGLYETNMRVVIADISTPGGRAFAYGVYGTVFGVSWGIGNLIMSLIFSTFKPLLLPYVISLEIASTITLACFLKEQHR